MATEPIYRTDDRTNSQYFWTDFSAIILTLGRYFMLLGFSVIGLFISFIFSEYVCIIFLILGCWL